MADQAGILVVDDDPDIRELLEDYLGGQGYRVVAVANAEAMRAALAEQLPDLVLLDVGLPGEDGLSLARHVREHYDVGIIMVSGAGETLDRIVGLEVGADDYVAKPFDPRELHARVKSVLRRYQQRARAVDDLIDLVGAVDGILQTQSDADANYFCLIAEHDFGAAERDQVRTTAEVKVAKDLRIQSVNFFACNGGVS